MSALPVEDQPSGAVPAHTGTGSRGLRSRPGGRTVRSGGVTARPGDAAARPAVHPLLPARKWLLPDGDCIFPGGGRSFSGRPEPGTVRPRAGTACPGAGTVRAGTGTPRAEARTARPAAGAVPSGPGAQRPVRPWADARRSVRPLPSVPVLSGAVVTAPGRAGLRPTRRGRIVLAVLAVLAVCGLFVAGASAAQASGPAAAHGAPGTAEQVIVQPGDSLWSIAQSADPNADARAIVQEILQANRLKTVNLTAGQRLWVPRG